MPDPPGTTIRFHAEQIRAQWGAVWPHIGPDIRSALVDARVTVAVTSLDRDAVSIEWVDSLRESLHMALCTGGYAT